MPLVGPLLALSAGIADAQRAPVQEAVIEFGRSGDTGDGYVNARLTVKYQFADCVGDIAVLYAMDRESVVVSGGYQYRGKWYAVPAAVTPPRPEVVDFAGPILDRVGRVHGAFADPYTQGSSGSGCIGQSKVVFTRKAKLGENSTPEQYLAFLQSLWIQPRSRPRLRNAAMEAWISAELAKARDDSLAQLADRRDRARRDSLDRAKAEREREAADRRADSVRQADKKAVDAERDARAARDASADSADRKDAKDAEEKARKDAADRQASGDAQTDRLNAIWRVEKIKFEMAEAAFARGDMATAGPLYEELSGSLVYGEQARARLAKVNEQQMAQGIMGLFSALGYFGNMLDETGIYFGPSYAPTGFPGDKGSAGLTFGVATSPQQRWIPYMDLLMVELGADAAKAVRYMPNKSFGAIAVGTTTPWLRIPLGQNAVLAPHFGYRAIVTDLRTVHLGQTGLILVTRGMLLRGDAVLIDGRARINGAIAKVF